MLLFGFGARDYMEAAEPGSADLLRAALPGPGALQVSGISEPPQAVFGTDNVVALRLSPAGAARVEATIAASFARTRTGAPIRLATTAAGQLYAARSDYALDHTCNTWAIAVLAAGGVPVSPTGVVLAGQAMAEARAAAASEPATVVSAGRSPPAGSAPRAHPAP
jgi:hypothetical protein